MLDYLYQKRNEVAERACALHRQRDELRQEMEILESMIAQLEVTRERIQDGSLQIVETAGKI